MGDLRIGERMHLKKKRRRVIPLKMRTRMVVTQTDKATGEVDGQLGPFYNTLHTQAFDEVLELMAGTSTLGPLQDADVSLKLTNTLHGGKVSGAPDFVSGPDSSGVAAVTKSAPSSAYSWTWEDNTTNTYDANFAELWFLPWNGSTGFEYEFCHIDISAAGTKPTDKNWHYEIILELYSLDTDITSAGLDMIMVVLTQPPPQTEFTGANMKLRPMSSATTDIAGTDQAADSDPTVDTANDEISWTWTVADGVFEGTWSHTRVTISGVNFRKGGCKTDGSSCGTKGPGEEWEYTYVFSLAQGS